MRWNNFETNLNQFWDNFDATMRQAWRNFEKTLNQFWDNFDATMRQL